MKTIRIFISSPGDVLEERQRAKQVIEHLRTRYAGRLELKAVLWEDLPLGAETSFQQGIDLVVSEEHAVHIAVFILWSRLGSPLGAFTRKKDGSAYRSGTEREFDVIMAARALNREQGMSDEPKVLVYTRTDEASFVERMRGKKTEEMNELLSQKKQVEQFLKEEFHDPATGANKRAYHPFDQPATFSKTFRTHLQELLDAAAGGVEAPPVWDVATMGSPFRGLEAFGFEHAPIFFGREDEILEAERALKRKACDGCAFLLLSGASGSGKSSLARAGLMPSIARHESDAQIPGWRLAAATPSELGEDLCAGLARLLCSPGVLPELNTSADTGTLLGESLSKGPLLAVDSCLRPALERARNGRPAASRLLLLIDQLEELFTNEKYDQTGRERFTLALEAMAKSGVIWVVATVRGDYYHDCQRLGPLMRMKAGAGQLDVLPPPADAYHRLIEYPARISGLSFESRDGAPLANRIMNDATVHPELLPLVSYVLRELFERRTPEGLLTSSVYESLGGAEGALAMRAEQTFERLSPKAQASFGAVARSLVRVGDGGQAVRDRPDVSGLEREPGASELVGAFVADRLFVTDRDARGKATVTVAHEAVLRSWKRLADWINENRSLLMARARVENAARVWEEQGRDEEYLISGGRPLAEAKTVLQEFGDGLSPGAQDHVRLSVRSARRKRWLLASTAVVLLAALVGGAVTYRRASERRALAKIYVERARQAAHNGDDARAVAFFAASDEMTPSHLARASASTYLELLPEPSRVFPMGASRALFAPDGHSVLIGGSWSRLWDAESGKPLVEERAMVDEVHVDAGVFSRDGSVLHTVGTSPTGLVIEAWDARTGALMTKVPWNAAVTGVSLSLSPDGTLLLLTASQAGAPMAEARLWDLSRGAETGTTMLVPGDAKGGRFSPDGSRLVVWSDTAARLFDGRSGAPASNLLEFKESLATLAFTPDGGTLRTLSLDGAVDSWDVRTGKPAGDRVFVAAGDSAAFDRTGSWLAMKDGHGEARLWRDLQRSKRSLKHGGRIEGLGFSPDGSLLLTFGDDPPVAKVWEVATERLLGSVYSAKRMECAEFSPDGRSILTCAVDEAVSWTLPTRPRSSRLPVSTQDDVRKFLLSGDALLVQDPQTLEARLWDAGSGSAKGPAMAHRQPIAHAEASADGVTLLTLERPSGPEGETVRLWELADGKPLGAISLPAGSRLLYGRRGRFNLNLPALTPDGARFVTEISSPSGSYQVWDARSGKALGPPLEDRFAGRNFGLDPHGRFAAVRRRSYTEYELWDVDAGKPAGDSFKAAERAIRSVAFSPDGKTLFVGSSDQLVTAWNLKSGKAAGAPLRHAQPVEDLVFSHDGRRIAAVGGRGVRVWNVADRKPVGREIPRGYPNFVVFSPDDKTLLTDKGGGHGAQLWDVETGQPIGPPLELPAEALAARFSADGRSAILWQGERSPVRWDLSWLPQPATAPELVRVATSKTRQVANSRGDVDVLPLDEWSRLIAR